MEAIPLAALSIGGSSQAPIPATRDRVYLGQTPGDCRDRRSKRRGKNVFDNEDLAAPFRKVAEFQNGESVFLAALVPQWLRALR
jgi:hypothetical protein